MEIQKQLKSHGAWVGKWTFILAATGSAVGLGNIWGFPYKAGTNGGGVHGVLYPKLDNSDDGFAIFLGER